MRALTRSREPLLLLALLAIVLVLGQLVNVLSSCKAVSTETWREEQTNSPPAFLRSRPDDAPADRPEDGRAPAAAVDQAAIDDEPKRESILLTTFLYSEKAANKKYLRMFAESARYAEGVDFLIVGDYKPPFDFPPNMKHVLLPWNDLIDLVVDKVLFGQGEGDLREDDGYKVNDFKPLFAFLFPHLVEGYDWWGHVDNDMVVGSIRKFLTDELLASSDILTAMPGNELNGELYTYGPFTLYRNNRVNNELFKLSALPLRTIMGTRHAMCFDEWGECGRGMPKHVNASMSGIIHNFRENLGIRWKGNALGMVQDRHCEQEEEYIGKEDCSPCEFDRGTLISAKPWHKRRPTQRSGVLSLRDRKK